MDLSYTWQENKQHTDVILLLLTVGGLQEAFLKG